LQLHELRLAVRSPIGGPIEDEEQTVRPHRRLEIVTFVELVNERKVRSNVADLGPKLSDLGQWRLSGREDTDDSDCRCCVQDFRKHESRNH
jgi:hypothetical protein